MKVDAITLDPGEDRLWSGVTAPDGEYGDFGTFMNPARVVQARSAETE